MLGTSNRPNTAPAVSSQYKITDHGNTTMKVVVRIRPENEAEISSSAPIVVRVLDTHVLVFDPQPENIPTFNSPQKPLNLFRRRAPILGRKYKDLRFAFDRVFDETATQLEVFEESTKNVVESVLDGVNCSVFAYGATGAGKTHTMLGTPEYPGVMFHTMMELYRSINQLRDEKTFQVAVSYCEVYNESIRDLLGSPLDGGSLELREDSKQGLKVSNLSKHQPQTAEELLSMLERGNMNRTQHPTDANATSSRSHAVFQVYVHQKPRTAAISAQMTCAKLSLIDLAGSERATVTTNRGARLREGANINKSLLALGNCINALAENKDKSVHVPYRNSKLTRLLKDSLGGNCRTVMIANVSPSSLTFEDTYNTLKYADRAKQIKTKVVRNVLNVDFHVSRYRTIVQDLQKEITELKAKLDTKAPCKKPVVDSTDSSRLQDLIRGVYSERSRLRKHMVDLDTQERETLLRICRKERDLHRIDALTGNEAKKAKLAAKVSALQQQIVDTERQKQMVHEYLYSNNEAVTRVQKEVKTATANSPPLQELMREVIEGRKLETENAHHWRQTKHLLRYVKAQEREISKTERVLLLALAVVRKQHTLLKAHNVLTPSVRDLYMDLLHAADGEKGVAWADQTLTGDDAGAPPNNFTVCQQALFDTFLLHASPTRRLSLEKHSPATLSKPVTGILSNGSNTGSTSNGGCSGSTISASSGVESGGENSETLSTLTSVSGGKASVIPDKPRMPTPIDDLSSSCGSTNSLYDTRLNTVINSYHQKPDPAEVKLAGRYTKLTTSSRTGTQRDSPFDTPRGTPEPYLTPLPSLHKLTLTRQNSSGIRGQNLPANPTTSTAHVPTSNSTALTSNSPLRTNAPRGQNLPMNPNTSTAFVPASNSTVFTSNSPLRTSAHSTEWSTGRPPVATSSAFSRVKPAAVVAPTKQTPPSTRPLSKLQVMTIPPPKVLLKSPQISSPAHPPTTSSFSKPAWNMFEDNFVTVPNTYAPLPTHTHSSFSPQNIPPSSVSVPNTYAHLPTRTHSSPQNVPSSSVRSSLSPSSLSNGSSQDTTSSSQSSSSTLKSSRSPTHQTVLCRPYPSSSPVVTVQTHSTVVNVHPPSSSPHSVPSTAHHSVTVGVNHNRKGKVKASLVPTSSCPITSSTQHSMSVGVNHKGKVERNESLMRQRPPAFVAPPAFDSTSGQQTHTVSPVNRHNLTKSVRSSRAAPVAQTHHESLLSHNRQNLSAMGRTEDQLLNSTFTVASTNPHHPHIPYPVTAGSSPGAGTGSGGKVKQSSTPFKPVVGALKPLFVNSPRALDERPRGNVTVEATKTRKLRGVPSYLQLTKSAASKRVVKIQDKENGVKKSTGRGRMPRIQPVAQPVW